MTCHTRAERWLVWRAHLEQRHLCEHKRTRRDDIVREKETASISADGSHRRAILHAHVGGGALRAIRTGIVTAAVRGSQAATIGKNHIDNALGRREGNVAGVAGLSWEGGKRAIAYKWLQTSNRYQDMGCAAPSRRAWKGKRKRSGINAPQRQQTVPGLHNAAACQPLAVATPLRNSLRAARKKEEGKEREEEGCSCFCSGEEVARCAFKAAWQASCAAPHLLFNAATIPPPSPPRCLASLCLPRLLCHTLLRLLRAHLHRCTPRHGVEISSTPRNGDEDKFWRREPHSTSGARRNDRQAHTIYGQTTASANANMEGRGAIAKQVPRAVKEEGRHLFPRHSAKNNR